MSVNDDANAVELAKEIVKTLVAERDALAASLAEECKKFDDLAERYDPLAAQLAAVVQTAGDVSLMAHYESQVNAYVISTALYDTLRRVVDNLPAAGRELLDEHEQSEQAKSELKSLLGLEMASDIVPSVRALLDERKQSKFTFDTLVETLQAWSAERSDLRERLEKAESQLAAIGGVCPYCGGRADLPPGHIERCYCLPRVRELEATLARVRALANDDKASITTRMAIIRRALDGEPSPNPAREPLALTALERRVVECAGDVVKYVTINTGATYFIALMNAVDALAAREKESE